MAKYDKQPRSTRISPGQTIRFTAKDGTQIRGTVSAAEDTQVQVWSEEHRTHFWLPANQCIRITDPKA